MADTRSIEARAVALRRRLQGLARETDVCVKHYRDLCESAEVREMADAVVDGLAPELPEKTAHDAALISVYNRLSLWRCFDMLEWISRRAEAPSMQRPAGPVPE